MQYVWRIGCSEKSVFLLWEGSSTAILSNNCDLLEGVRSDVGMMETRGVAKSLDKGSGNDRREPRSTFKPTAWWCSAVWI